MKSRFLKLIYTILFLALTVCILTHSKLSLQYACLGLGLWYDTMIPALLPFMILSGIMIRLNLTKGFTTVLYPVINPLYRISPNACYAIIMGFLCGFPMGAKTIADLYEREMITETEARFLLAFCNNIGPVYFVSFVLPLLERKLIAPYLFGMYVLPLIYGLILRYTLFKKSISSANNLQRKTEYLSTNSGTSLHLLTAVDDSIHSSIQSMLTLGGYMILFNLLNVLPHTLLNAPPKILAPLLEISGGLRLLGKDLPLYTLLVLPFGGFSCIAQTYSCIKKTSLSITDYIFHKFILTALTVAYYLLWRLISSSSFLC